MSENQDLGVEESNNQAVNEKLQENYEQLQSIGAQRIHEQTHIPKVQCEDLVSGYFESMNKIQFTGFISILEREYKTDLSALKEEGLAFFKSHNPEPVIEESKVFVAPKRSKNYTLYYILAAVIIFLFAVFGLSSEEEKVEHKIDNKKIEQVTSKIAPIQEDIIQEIPQSEPEEIQSSVSELKIIPNVKLWVGYIDLDTGRKLQKTLEANEEFSLDPDTHWLLSLGHGDVSFKVNGELEEFKIARNIRLVYKDSELKKIGYQEFLSLNKGKEW
jgi:hypothetical protein